MAIEVLGALAEKQDLDLSRLQLLIFTDHPFNFVVPLLLVARGTGKRIPPGFGEAYIEHHRCCETPFLI